MLDKTPEAVSSSTTHSLFSIIADETLYSWCAANHSMRCSRNSAATALALLGALHAVRQHEFPHSFASFVAVSRAAPNSILSLLRSHTVAGFYLPFLDKKSQDELALEALKPHSTHWTRAALGSTRTQKIAHPLKWCRHCVLEDVESIGRAYWHALHQYPTSLICTLHNEPLRWNEGRSKQWRLPHKEEAFATVVPDNLFQAACSTAALNAALQKTACIDMASLRRSALHRLQEIGVIHSLKGARHERVAQWFTSTTSCRLALFTQPKLISLINGSAIPGLLWRHNKSTAISWMLFWSALQWESTKEAVQSFTTAAAGKGPSIRGQLQLFNDLDTNLRCTPEYVRDAFQSCNSYADVMKCLCVSRHDVVRWLECDPELRSKWKARLREGRQLECIERITGFVQMSPRSGRADIEKNCSAELRWMRDHAPSQLAALIRSIPSQNSIQSQLKF